MTIKEPLLGQLNQGSIFSCARAERYPGRDVHGVVLTARCDLEQDKFNILNYAPVVTLKDWLTVDGYELIISRITADLTSKIESGLKVLGFPSSIMNSQTPQSILNYLKSPHTDAKLRKEEARFAEIDARASKLDRWRTGYSKLNLDIFSDYDSIVRSLVKDLIHQKLSGYYFFPHLESSTDETGYVALLREINHLPRDLAHMIAAGLDSKDGRLVQQSGWAAYVDFEITDFAMPVGEVVSPQVEHLLQTFSHLFGRIGLPDPDKAKVETLCSIRPEMIKESA